MELNYFVKRDYKVTSPLAGIKTVKDHLMRHGAVVVVDDDHNNPLGVLTPGDILRRPHNLVIDCLSPKPMLNKNSSIETALETMLSEGTEVLIVHSNKRFEGIIFKNDLMEFLSSQKIILENKVISRTEKLQKAHSRFQKSERILKAIYDSTESIIFLVAPDYTTLFFNRNAFQSSLTLTGKEINTGDSFREIASAVLNRTGESFTEVFQQALQNELVVTEDVIKGDTSAFGRRTEYRSVFDDGVLVGVSITITNISDRKRDELLIQKQNTILKEIIYDQSHGLRLPVANILGIIQLFGQKNLLLSDPEAIQMLETSATQLDHMIRAIVKKSEVWTHNPEIEKENSPT